MEEQSEQPHPREHIADELGRYGQSQEMSVVNRDGDRYYVECPGCGSTDLKPRRFLACRDCQTCFFVYTEDGLTTYDVLAESKGVRGYGETIRLVKLETNNDFYKVWLPRNIGRFKELQERYPDARVVTLSRDLEKKDGKAMDAHGHEIYRRFVMIPLD